MRQHHQAEFNHADHGPDNRPQPTVELQLLDAL
jgi:hypothetical protein